MFDTKSILASKTIWGGAVALIAGVAGVMGYTVDASAQADIVNLITAIAGIAGGAVSIYGRIAATKKIG